MPWPNKHKTRTPTRRRSCTNMAAMNQLQQQFGNLQNLVQEQAQQSGQAPPPQAPITSFHATMEALANSHLEQQQTA